MHMLAFLQVADAPTWVAPTMAISLVVIALVSAGFAFVVVGALVKMRLEIEKASGALAGMKHDVEGTVKAVRHLVDQGREALAEVQNEAGAFAQTSRQIRRRVVRGVDRIEERLEDLDALYGVIHEEVEDTALDLAASLRSFRQGHGVIGRVRRMLVPNR